MALTNPYCTLDEAKTAIGIDDESDLRDDAKIELAISAASRHIEGFCRQRFWLDDSVVIRTFFCEGGAKAFHLYDDIDDDIAVGIGTATGLVVKVDQDGNGTFETTLVKDTDFVLLSPNATANAKPYTALQFGLLGSSLYCLPWANGRPALQITAKWGWPTLPDEVTQACVLQAAQLFKAKDAVFGVAAFGEFGPLRVRAAMNPIAAGILNDAGLVRPAVG